MAIQSRSDVSELVLALVYAHNAMQSELVSDGYHRDLTQNTNGPLLDEANIKLTTVTVSLGNAVDLASTVALGNQLLGVLNQHMFDDQAHLVRDLVNQPNQDGYLTVQANLDADSGLSEIIVNLNALKVLFNAHLTASGVHPNNDTVNSVATANATNLGTAQTLANALKTSVNAHMASVGSNNCPRIAISRT